RPDKSADSWIRRGSEMGPGLAADNSELCTIGEHSAIGCAVGPEGVPRTVGSPDRWTGRRMKGRRDMTTTAKRKTRPKRLICSCCGESCIGRQWWNRDTGYGLCDRCVPFVRSSRGMTEDEF